MKVHSEAGTLEIVIAFFLTTSNDGPFNNFGNMDESMPSQL